MRSPLISQPAISKYGDVVSLTQDSPTLIILTYFLLHGRNTLNMDTQRTETVFFSVKGQVVVPRRLRKEFGIEEGTRAVIYKDGDRIVLKPMTLAHYRAMRGSLKGTGAFKAFVAERKREREL